MGTTHCPMLCRACQRLPTYTRAPWASTQHVDILRITSPEEALLCYDHAISYLSSSFTITALSTTISFLSQFLWHVILVAGVALCTILLYVRAGHLFRSDPYPTFRKIALTIMCVHGHLSSAILVPKVHCTGKVLDVVISSGQ